MNGAGPTEKLEDRHHNMHLLPPKSAVISAYVEPVSRHAMSMGGRSRVPRREKPELSLSLSRTISGCRSAKVLDPVQDEIGPFPPQGVTKSPAGLPQQSGLTMLHGSRRHARIESARPGLSQRSQQRCNLCM